MVLPLIWWGPGDINTRAGCGRDCGHLNSFRRQHNVLRASKTPSTKLQQSGELFALCLCGLEKDKERDRELCRQTKGPRIFRCVALCRLLNEEGLTSVT